MNKAKPLAIYALIAGTIILITWPLLMLTSEVKEYLIHPTEFRFHLIIEFCTAGMLIINGLRVLYSKGQGEGLLLVSIGMLLYSLINSIGINVEKGPMLMVWLFVFLLALTLFFTYDAFHGTPNQS